MSREAALDRARDLKGHLQAFGVPVSIELQTGRSGGWNALKPHANLGHHVASRRSQGLTPFLWLVKEGRSDVTGPLCNGYLGFDGVARLITMDWANHPGAGGPWTVPGATIPEDNGRPYIFGWECEGGYELSDWPAAHRDTMARCFAATLRWMGRDERSHGEHGNPWAPGRKFDRIHYYSHLAEARAEIRALLEDDMPTLDEILDGVVRRLSNPDGDFMQRLIDADGDFMRRSGNVNSRRVLERFAEEGNELSDEAVKRIAHAVYMHFEAHAEPTPEPTPEPM